MKIFYILLLFLLSCSSNFLPLKDNQSKFQLENQLSSKNRDEFLINLDSGKEYYIVASSTNKKQLKCLLKVNNDTKYFFNVNNLCQIRVDKLNKSEKAQLIIENISNISTYYIINVYIKM